MKDETDLPRSCYILYTDKDQARILGALPGHKIDHVSWQISTPYDSRMLSCIRERNILASENERFLTLTIL